MNRIQPEIPSLKWERPTPGLAKDQPGPAGLTDCLSCVWGNVCGVRRGKVLVYCLRQSCVLQDRPVCRKESAEDDSISYH